MKRLLNILFLLSLVWLSAYAQSQEPVQEPAQEEELDLPTLVKNVSYIYRNDDHFNGFADSEVDSIKFSRIDIDGIEHADFVTQEIYTPDSIYRIPLAAVDSVVCQQPPIELQDDVVQLSEDQCGFVLRADSTSILFRSDIPRDLLPDRGKVLLAMNSDSRRLLHFAGRVLDVQRTPEGVLVTCDTGLQLEDIFRRLTAVMFTSPRTDGGDEQEWDVPHSGNREKFDPFSKSFSWSPKSKSYTDPKTGEKTTYTPNYVSGFRKTLDPIKKNLLDFIDDKPSWLNNEENKIDVTLTFDIAYRQKFLIDFFKDKNDWVIPSLYFYWRPTFLPSLKGEAEVKLIAEWDKEIKCIPDVPAIGIWIPPTPVSPPIRIGEVNIHLTQFYFLVGGETEFTYSFTAKKVFDVELELNSSGPHITDMTKKENGGYTDQSGLSSNGFTFPSSELSGDIDHFGSVYVWLAWKPTFGLSLINERVLTAKFETKIGPWVQLNFEKTNWEPEHEPSRFYQEWSPSHLLTKLHLETDFKVIFAEGSSVEKKFSLKEALKNWNIGDGKGWDFMVHRYGIFPGFGAPQLTSNWNKSMVQRGVISFTTPYKNPIHGTPVRNGLDRTFLAADLGVGVYKVNGDGTQDEVAVSFKPKKEKGWFNKDEGTYTTEFSGLKRGVYRVAPVFDAAFFNPIRALPEADIVIPPSAVTEEATSVGKHHCFLNGYALGLKGFADLMGGTCTLGWILKKADENSATTANLTIQDNDKIEVLNDQQAVNETENGEDKLSFGPLHSTSKDMESHTRCDGLTPATNYIYRAWAAYTDGKETTWLYGDIKELITDASEDEERCSTDLGLSVDWACYNVGAAKPYQYGNYYAWGEKETKKEYTADKYKLPSKHNIAGNTDYDVATTWNRGKNSGWRMPTKAEIQELIDNCTMEWVTEHKVKGMRFTSKINGNSIFLPAAGNKYAKKVYSNGIGGCYWSGDIDEESLMEVVENATIGKIDLGEGEGEGGGEGGQGGQGGQGGEGDNVEVENEDEGQIGIGEGDARELTAEEKADAWRLHFNNVEEEGKAPHNEAGRCFYGRTIRPVREKEKPKAP